MLRTIRGHIISRFIAIKFALLLLFQLGVPSLSWALTGGPSQPEVQSFEPIGTDQMVDAFSGDFTYNIPLMEVGNYPLNLSYNSGISMDQEASMVGLGWNLNPGAVTRQKRGLPDDLKGDEVHKERNKKVNRTYGLTGSFGAELFGFDVLKVLEGKASLNYSLGITYNNYRGVSFQNSVRPSLSAKTGGETPYTGSLGVTVGGSSTNGLDVSPNLSFKKTMMKDQKGAMDLGLNAGLNFNTRKGTEALSFGYNVTGKEKRKAATGYHSANTVSVADGSASLDYAPTTYTPANEFPNRNSSVSGSFKFGGTLFGQDGTFNISAYYSEQRLKVNEMDLKGYGYLYSQHANGPKALMDFNRDNERPFNENMPSLSVPVHTQDVFNVAGQGIGGSYRPHRGGVGFLKDPEVSNPSFSGDLSVELGSGNTAKVGGDVTINDVMSRTGAWTTYNYLGKDWGFTGNRTKSDPLYEPVYFKQAGEKSGAVDQSFVDNILDESPISPVITIGPGWESSAKRKVRGKGTTKDLSGVSLEKKEREMRNQPFHYITKGEKNADPRVGIEPYVPANGKGHHIAEVRSIKPDGARYVFGIPAYNTLEKKMTFNVSGRGHDCGTGLAQYEPEDRSPDNERGVDHYFESTETPPYAHSYMLSAVLSPDYADSDNERGATRGDRGSYTRFNYFGDSDPSNDGGKETDGTKTTAPMVKDYKWRTPFKKDRVDFNEGLKYKDGVDDGDDKGNILYGKKDLWNVTSIETKTHIAVLHYSDREDAKEVAGIDGGMGSRSMKKLDSIALYALPEYEQSNDPEPIKKVHFEYSYELCPGIHNGTDGKLTLEELYYTHGDSRKGKYNRYRFNYADTDQDGTQEVNHSYHPKAYDRWGNYKEQPAGAGCDPDSSGVPNSEDPYVDQRDRAQQDGYAAAWSMSSIELPSGGKMEISYEADDYAYVQDRRAMQMFHITGAGEATNESDISDGVLDAIEGGQNEVELFKSGAHEDYYKYLYFELMDDADNTDIEKEYLEEIVNPPNGSSKEDSLIYFKALVDQNASSGGDVHEFVTGYFKIVEDGIGKVSGTSGSKEYGYIQVEPVEVGKANPKDAHPISFASWNFQRKNLPRVASDIEDEHSGNVEEVAKALASSFDAYKEVFKSFYKQLGDQDHGRRLKPDRSWVRLQNPTKRKIGGGARVSRIELSDEWEKMTDPDEPTSKYGKTYSYELHDGTSSGVAKNEPMVGGDENAMRQPEFYSEKSLLAEGFSNYTQRPYAKSYLPSPGVGYSRVEVRNIHNDKSDLSERYKSGRTVHRFYTAREFPFEVDETGVDPIPQKSNMLQQLLKADVKDHMTTSQGFVAIKNDMHGKPLSKFTYPEGKEPSSGDKDMRGEAISGKEYIYRTGNSSIPDPLEPGKTIGKKRQLVNKVPTIDDQGKLEEATIGVEHEIIADSREEMTETYTMASQLNGNAFMAAVLPAFIPMIWGSLETERTRYRQATIMKEVKRYGILDRVIAWDSGSRVATKNELWDKETGEVLLTETTNEFKDRVQQLDRPAHWGYDRMGPASRNLRAEIAADVSSSGKVTQIAGGTDPGEVLVEGDEVLLNDNKKLWVLGEDGSTDLYLIDGSGSVHSGGGGTDRIKVLRSGRRNQQTTSIGEITALGDLIDLNQNELVVDASKDIVEAKAVEYDEEWGTFCGKEGQYPDSCVCGAEIAQDLQALFNAVIAHELGDQSMDVEKEYCYNTNDCDYCSDPDHCNNGDNPFPAYLEDFFVGSSFYQAMESKCEYDVGSNDMPVTFHLTYEDKPDDEEIALGMDVFWPCEPDSTSNMYCSVLPLNQNEGMLGGIDYHPQHGKPEVLGISDVRANDPGCGGTVHDFDIDIELDDGRTVTKELELDPDVCGYPCFEPPQDDTDDKCGLLAGDEVNPFLEGLRGDWRQDREWLYLTDRDPMTADTGGSTAPIDVREGGVYENFSPFWTEPGSGEQDWDKDPVDWTWKQRVTEFHPDGKELENEDALERHSSALFGYQDDLVKAISKNSRYRQIAFEGFEDEDFYDGSDECEDHFGMLEHRAKRTDEEHHTGRYSIELQPQESIDGEGVMLDSCSDGTDDVPYTIKECDCIGRFGPRNGEEQEYLLSFWVKEEFSEDDPVRFDHDAVSVHVNQAPVQLHSKTKLIDGWQKRDYTFTLPAWATGDLRITFENGNTDEGDLYLDDIRVLPFNGSMRSFVYDPLNLRYVAELDENNFATFYEYDKEGKLVRIKKETEEGIKTVQESREHQYHKPITQ